MHLSAEALSRAMCRSVTRLLTPSAFRSKARRNRLAQSAIAAAASVPCLVWPLPSVRARAGRAEPVGSASRSTETAGARACATAMEESTALAPRSGHPPNSVRKVAALWRTSTVRAHDRMPACPHGRIQLASMVPLGLAGATAFALRVHLCGSARRARLVALCAVTRGCSGTVCAADSRGRHREC